MEEEEALYDEFGNYIGPELSDEGSDSGSDLAQDDDEGAQWEDELEDEIRRAKDSEAAAAQESKQMDLAGDSGTAIVLHEDKQYYKSASDVYGEDVEVVIGDEDAMAITVPILAPSNGVKFSAEVKQDVPELSFKWDFVAGMMDHPTLTRAVAVIGGFHHGKSSLMDIFVKATHKRKRTAHLQARLNEKDVEDVFYRYTDTRIDERERELSVKCTPMTLVLPANSGKSHLMHLYDTPGHPNFSDEQTAALRVCDGAVVVVDAAEGVMLQTKKSIQHALQNQLPLVLCISKVDRLVLELKVPPKDAYHKLKFIVEEVNGIVRAASGGKHPTFHPAKGNVCFASGTHNWLFTLESFARSYSNYYQNFNPKTFAKTLWGDVYMHPKKRTFHKEPVVNGTDARAHVCVCVFVCVCVCVCVRVIHVLFVTAYSFVSSTIFTHTYTHTHTQGKSAPSCSSCSTPCTRCMLTWWAVRGRPSRRHSSE
jgi:U5 small nuclear ribonucleoprotein component